MNKELFQTVLQTDCLNNAGGKAYKLTAQHALAQITCTGCLNGTYYSSAKSQLDTVKQLLIQVEPEFIGQVAIYAHKESYMKDMPALCLAYLASDFKNPQKVNILKKIFHEICDSSNMLRNFVQIIRSNTFGRKSFGSSVRRLIREWFDKRTATTIFYQSIGNDPSLVDILKMVHPKPTHNGVRCPEKAALFAYLLGAKNKEGQLQRLYIKNNESKVIYSESSDNLPEIVKSFDNWKKDKSLPVPALNFRFLDNEKLTSEQWKEIASKANWLTTLKNLNAYASHEVFNDKKLVDLITNRLSNAQEIEKIRVFPYQIMMAFMATGDNVPSKIKNALQDAMEVATKNVPSLGRVVVCPDVSGSMKSPITGYRGSATTKVRCIDVAALISSTILRTNQNAEVVPFEHTVVDRISLNSRDSVMTNAQKLASIGGGGTNCSAPLKLLNQKNTKADIIVYVSDNESWVDNSMSRSTEMMNEWKTFKENNKNAKLVCIDLVPNIHSQVKEHEDILQIGGWSDTAFDVISKFIKGGWNKNFWVDLLKNYEFS